jgi:hypothetical protein
MQQFIEKFRDQISGVLSGFDRLIFRGSLRRLNYAHYDKGLRAVVSQGMEQYLCLNRILFKDYRDHVTRIREQLKEVSLEPLKKQGVPVEFVQDPKIDKDKLAREFAAKHPDRRGTVCVISTMEVSPTFEHRGTHIIRRARPCPVLYHYQIHPEVGWMHARIQTWFPFNIQIAMNGREWLARQMEKVGLSYCQADNCFPWLEDTGRAQTLMDQQLKTNWSELLNSVGRQLNPILESVFKAYPCEYYWTVFQSEWATDITFCEKACLKRLMPLLTRHSMLSFSSADIMRYFGRRVNLSGAIPANFAGVLQMDVRRREQGERVKFQMNGNSAKFYDKAYREMGSVFRAAETTINKVEDLRVYRPKEGGPEDDLQWRPLRRGIADLHRRAEVSQKANERVINALGSVDDSRRVEELTAQMQKPVMWNKRRVRALRPWADDHALLLAINDGKFLTNGLRNRDLQQMLYSDETTTPVELRRRSAVISRKLRMLRAHGLIHKVPKTHRYQVSNTQRSAIIAVLTTATTTLHQLNQLPTAA